MTRETSVPGVYAAGDLTTAGSECASVRRGWHARGGDDESLAHD